MSICVSGSAAYLCGGEAASVFKSFLETKNLPGSLHIALPEIVMSAQAKTKETEARQWLADHKDKLREINEWVEKNGLPLEKHHLF